jgi:hypothetical protein
MKTHLSTLALLLASLTSAHAIGVVLPPTPDLSQVKLMGRWPATLNPTGYGQGDTVALSEKWALVGASLASDANNVSYDGAVQVFSAVTGAWGRTLRPPAPVADNMRFGGSLAVTGDLALVGAFGVNGSKGVVYVVNLTTGALARTLIAADGLSGDYFGSSISVSSGKVLIGASGDDAGQGSAYLFDLATGAQLAKIKGSASIAGDNFGSSVAMDGGLALIGTPFHGSDRGAVYVFDMTTPSPSEITMVVPSLSVAGDGVGFQVALSQGIAVMSAPYRNSSAGAIFTKDLRTNTEHLLTASDGAPLEGLGRYPFSVCAGMILTSAYAHALDHGAAYVFDLVTGVQLREIQPSDSTAGQFFGTAVALAGSNALIGCIGDSISGHPAIGSAYLIKPLMTTLPLTKVAARTDFAPGVPETTFSVFNDAFINHQGETAFTAKLTGAGSHANKDVGLWTSLQGTGNLDLADVTNVVGGQITAIGTPIINQADLALYPLTYKVGIAGFTAANNHQLVGLSSTGSFALGTDFSYGPFNSAKVASFNETVQSFAQATNRFVVSCTLKIDANTTASSDSGFLIYDVGNSTDGRREGLQVQPSNTFNSITYGQFTGRLSYLRNSLAYSAAIAGPVANNAAVMQKAFGVTETLIAQKGMPAPGANGALFSAFISETTSSTDVAVYRATISGPVATNEGIWNSALNFPDLQKGKTSPVLPAGLTVAKFINYWVVSAYNLIALVQLAGPGVGTANDQALILIQSTGTGNVLLREGQAAPGCSPATIGVINRVEVDPWQGTYAIIATLVGAPAGTNLALFVGDAIQAGNDTTLSSLRRAVLYLRKGQLYSNQPSKIKSFSLPSTNLTVGGAGGTGRGRAISWNRNFVITVEFDNAVRQIMKGSL